MDKITVLDFVCRWSPEFAKGCFSTYEGHICITAAFYLLSALILLVSCSLLLYHRCRWRCRHWSDEAACAMYCFIGNLCSAVGALLSNQFGFLISMASYVAILDIVHILSITCSIYLWYYSKTGKTMRMMSKRRRQHFYAVPLLFAVGGSIYLCSAVHLSPIRVPTTGRRLLNLFYDDYIENLGYILGLLSFAISWTAKFPFFLKANRGEQSSGLQLSSRILCSLAGGLYASSILLYDIQPRTVVKAMPWILAAICCALMDLAIVALAFYRSKHKRPSVRSLDSDTESLLRKPSGTNKHCNNNINCHIKQHLNRCKSPKGTDMGLYMDVNIQPMRKVLYTKDRMVGIFQVCLKEVTISRNGSSDALPLKRTVRVVRVDEPCSSGTSTDSSSLSSELEWDFEETKTQWIPVEEAPEDLQNIEAFPLQEWQVSSGSKSISGPCSHVCLCNRAQLAEKLGSRKTDHK
ncbi:Transmembrane protein 44 [Triplophysa tibetana]|uniref:Transmembrane protein 44 n=1 Tax=Triplophysa tibetana TaxID=1572043 RepID=A0A5A9NEQ9_9TELE|nr:Transmembrane protein 44 [Triplophysa tibetana]